MKIPKKVTTAWIESRRHPKNRPRMREEGVVPGHEGLVLRVEESGGTSALFRYTSPVTRKREWIVFGEIGPGLTLAEVFQQHLEARGEVARGLDPKEERKRRQAEAQKARQHRTAVNAVTIRNVIAEWGWHWARRERKRPREAVRLLKVNLAPWAERPVNELRRRDAIVLLDAIVARDAPVMANRIRDLGHQAFTFCVARDLISVNPFLGVPNPGGDEESKDRFLDRDEIKTVWSTLDKPESGISRRLGLALKLILVTAQRPGEVLKARFDQFDIKQRVWTIPAEVIKTVKMKKRRGKKKARKPRGEHVVPLTDLAIELLEELRPLANDRPCLLPAQRAKLNPDGHIEEKGLAHALRDQIDEKTGMLFGFEPFTPHDLRRTAATMMTGLGIPRHPDVAKVLNHADEEDDTTGIYDRWEYWPQKQRALTVWETELRAMIEGKPSTIVPLAKTA